MEIKFEISENKLPIIQKRLNRVISRAHKSGLPIPVLNVEKNIEREHYVYDALAEQSGNSEKTRLVVSKKILISLSNFTPEFGDFSFVGSRYYSSKEGEVVASNFGTIPDDISKRDKLCCDHCEYSRKRLFTWVVQNKRDDSVTELGSSCVEAFTGYNLGQYFHEGLHDLGKIMHSIKQYADNDTELAFDEEIRTVLAVALRRVSDTGFVSSSVARYEGSTPTWQGVLSDLEKYRRDDLSASDILVTGADFLLADEMVEYFSQKSHFDFYNSVRSATMKQYASLYDVALLTAGAKTYLEKLALDKKNSAVRTLVYNSVPIGNVKERLEGLTVKVYSIKEYQGNFGLQSYVTLIDSNSNLLKWKASGETKLKVGEAYIVTGTVKEHKICERGAFEGLPETVLTRISIKHELGPTTFERDDRVSKFSDEDNDALNNFLGL